MKNILPILILLGVVVSTAPSYSQLDSCYTTREELYDLIFTLQDSADANPDMHHIRVDSIGHSRGDQLGIQYPIYAVKFSDNVDEFEDEPTVLIIAHIHAEEVAGLEGVVKFMRLLLHRRFSSPYNSIISNAQVYIIPTMNPDGLEVISSGIETDSAGFPVRRWDQTWRKNGYRPPELPGDCNIFPGVGRDSCGVDLNRNFELNWIHGDPLWWETAFEAYDYFRGPAPASEPETQAVMNFADQIKPAISLVWHSSRTGNFSSQCFTAWDWGTTASLPKYPPDYLAISTVRGLTPANGFASSTEIWPEGGSNYQSVYGGTHNGCTQDWFYWKLGCIQIVTETSGAGAQIQPPCAGGDQTSIHGLAGTLVAPNEWLCRRVFNGRGSVTPNDMDDQGAALAIYTQNAETLLPMSAEWRIVNTWTPLLPPWYTNEQHGRATFLPPPGDSLFIMARKEGFVSDTAMVGITPGPNQTQSVTLYLQPLPWHNLTIRVEDEAGTAIPARVHLISDFPMWLPVEGEATISKPRGNYAVEVIPEGSNKIAIWRHFWMDTDTSFTFVLPNGQERMNENFDNLSHWTSGGEGNRWEIDPDTTAQNFGNSLATNPAVTYRPKYAANADTWIEYNNSISLDNDNAAHLAFSRRGRLEACEDSLLVEVRIDGSENWEVAKGYSDMELPWVRDWVNLTPWAGETIRLRFRLKTDESLEELGLHIDNVSIVSGTDQGGSETPATVPFSYKITNAYPNPFNPSTTIAYEVAAPGLVTFAIFNLLGQEVWRSNESLPTAGAYTFRWDGVSTSGAALSSGLYFVQMQTNVVHSTKKLLLLK